MPVALPNPERNTSRNRREYVLGADVRKMGRGLAIWRKMLNFAPAAEGRQNDNPMETYQFIDTHTHLDGDEYAADRDEVIARAQAAGVSTMLVPAIDVPSSGRILALCQQYPGVLFPMVGLHPEEVRADWRQQLAQLKDMLNEALRADGAATPPLVAIGEVGLDYYWSREFEQEQLLAFEEQVRWSAETGLPLMIHCRKAQNEMVAIIKKYAETLPGGVFHCFTGNALEARQLLQFPRFVLGIGGVLTFKKSNLPATLIGDAPEHPTVPLDRLVLETDSPYMAPVPLRGQRNEPAFVAHVLKKLAECYGVSEAEIARRTNENVERVFNLKTLCRNRKYSS